MVGNVPGIWTLLGRARRGMIIGAGMWALLLILSVFMVM